MVDLVPQPLAIICRSSAVSDAGDPRFPIIFVSGWNVIITLSVSADAKNREIAERQRRSVSEGESSQCAFAAVKVWWADDVGFFCHRTAL